MTTTLTLLVRDGTCFMAFTPALSSDQYTGLVERVKPASTCDEMRDLVREWAEAQELFVGFKEDDPLFVS